MQQNTTKIDRHGRIVIPADFRRALGLREGDDVTVQIDDGTLRVVPRPEAIRRAQALVKKHTEGKRSLVEELARERRAEVRAE